MRMALLPFALLAVAHAQSSPVPARNNFSAAMTQQHTLQFLGRRGIGRAPRGARAANYAAALKQWARAQLQQQSAGGSGVWTALGPMQVSTFQQRYGLVTGRVTSIAVDPSDPSGNTVYVGTTGGGVWYSTNADSNQAANVTFTPLTDNIGDFAPPAPSSLSIGAVSVQPNGTGVVLAGTGDPNDASDSYYGVGLLRSTNHGQSWTLISVANLGAGQTAVQFYGNAFAGFAWSTVNPDLVVAAVTDAPLGQQQGIESQGSNNPMGIYYSTDAGATWALATLSDGGTVFEGGSTPITTPGNAVTSIVWNPVRKMFYAAVRYHGYYQSSDGENWTRLANQPGSNLNPDSQGNTLCPADPGTAGSTACPIYRGTIAVQPLTGDMFAITVDQYGNDQGLWQDVCNQTGSNCSNPVVQFSQQIADAPLEASDGSGTIPQAAYDLSLAAVPWEQDTILLVGTRDLYRCSLANGCAWRNTTNTDGCAAAQVAPSQHAVEPAFSPQGLVYFGNDGGLWRTTDVVNQTQAVCGSDDATHFQNLNAGLGSLAEVSDFAVNPSSSTELLAALGELGTAGTASSNAVWPQVLDGEGDHVAIDPATPQNWFATILPGVAIEECMQGASCTPADFQPAVGASQVGTGEAQASAPAAWMLDPSDSSNLVLGTCRVWRGPADGSGWSTGSSSLNLLSTMLDGDQQSYCNGNQWIRSLSAAPSGSGGAEQMYAGMTGTEESGALAPGHIYTQTIPAAPSGPVPWTDLTENPVTNQSVTTRFNPGGYDVSSVFTDPHDATGLTVYATIEGFPGNLPGEDMLYQSINGGQSWLNLTSNLPPVPANSVLVDPNNPLIVYVATDAGVWYTPNVNECAIPGQNCWNAMGSGLPDAPVTKLAAYNFGSSSSLFASTYGRGIWQIPLLTSGTATTSAEVTPSALNFGSQQVQTVSTPQTVTVKATGNLNLNVTSVLVTGDFSVTSNACSNSVPPQSYCTISVSFAPTATGSRTGTLSILANVPGGQYTVDLSGTGTTPAAVTLTPASLNFGSELIGQTAPAQNVVIANSGSVPATLTQIAVSGDFAISTNTCGTSIAADSSCTVGVTFSPAASGSRAGALTVTDSAGTQTAILSGTGQSPATDNLAPTSLSFGTQQVGSSSLPQPVTLTNTGDTTLQGIQVQVSGDFQFVNNCGASLSGHASCTVQVSYLPTQVGPESGQLTITDALKSQIVTLTGTGQAGPGISLTPDPPPALVGYVGGAAASPVQTMTLTNNGGVPLSGFSVSVSPGFAITANQCAGTLAVGSACTLGVTFTASADGAVSGTLSVHIASSGQSYSVPLQGQGDDFTLAVVGKTTQTITSGATASYTFSATPGSGTTGNVDFTCSGAPAGSTCTLNPANASFNGQSPVSVTVTVVTGLTSASSIRPSRSGWAATFFCLMPMGWLGLWRSRRRFSSTGGARVLLLACLLWTGVLAAGYGIIGCGVHASGGTTGSGSGSGSGGGGQITPSGTYTLTVTAAMPTATNPSLTQTQQVQLIVE
jgi:hypothetical protein